MNGYFYGIKKKSTKETPPSSNIPQPCIWNERQRVVKSAVTVISTSDARDSLGLGGWAGPRDGATG